MKQYSLPASFQLQTVTLIPIDYFDTKSSGRFLVMLNGSLHEALYSPEEIAFRLLKDPDRPIRPWEITSYAFIGTATDS